MERVVFVPGYRVVGDRSLRLRAKCKHTEDFVELPTGDFKCNLCTACFNFCSECNKSFAVSTLTKYGGVCGRCYVPDESDESEPEDEPEEPPRRRRRMDEDQIREVIRHLARQYRA